MRAATEAPGVEVLECGCKRTVERSGSRRVLARCEEGERLWGELIAARDALRDHRHENVRHRAGRKQRIDAFAEARGEYWRHVGIA